MKRTPTHDRPQALRHRSRGAATFVAGLILVLGLAFFRVQVLSSTVYRLQADSNRLRPVEIPAPRGSIFDRHGRVIADNVPAYTVSIVPLDHDSTAEVLARLAPHLELSDARIEELLVQRAADPNAPLEVVRDASFEHVSALEERRTRFPDVRVEMRPSRHYVSGRAVAHVVGYLGEISERELADDRFADGRYERGTVVGRSGIERQYERILQGTPGVRYVEVDARNGIVGDFAGRVVRPAIPGADIRLSIDRELQEWIHRIFPTDRTGAVVALDPSDGSVLALYSAPTFDPNDFVGGIDPATWRELASDTLDPLLDRAVQSAFPPASTFKPLVAAMGLDLGVVTPDDLMERPCTGGMMYGGRYRRCWKGEGHGFLDLPGAIRHSCDVYFYQLGLRIGLDRFLARGVRMGLTEPTGIDLPGERAGVFPSDRSFWRRRFGYAPREGEVLSLAIGQGPNSQTPLKMAQAYVALARDGTAPAPTLFLGRDDRPRGWSMRLSKENLARIREGLRGVTSPGGTAYLASLEYWDLIGKTGTGENRLSQLGLGETDAWFVGMAGPRGGPPEIVVAVTVRRGGGGSSVAAPVMAKAADFYLRKKYGLPVDTVQTLGEHLARGRWPGWAGR